MHWGRTFSAQRLKESETYTNDNKIQTSYQDPFQDAPQAVHRIEVIYSTPSSPQPLPWAHLWPQLADFYYHNIPDFSGHGLYLTRSRHNKEFATFALQEPSSFTAQIIVAEAARVENPIPTARMLWLKATAISLINEALRDSNRATSVGTVGSVAAMTANAIASGDSVASKAHMKGLQQMLRIRGGLVSLDDFGFSRCLVSYVDSLYSYFEGGERHIVDWETPSRSLRSGIFIGEPAVMSHGNAGMFPRLADVAYHPLRLASQPLYSNLSQFRLRNHLLMSLGSPLTPLLYYIGVTGALAEAMFVPPYMKSPKDVLTAAGSIEYYLLAQNSNRGFLQLSHPMYSELDQLNHKIILGCVTQYALILVTALRYLLNRTTVSKQRLDHNIQALYAVGLESIIWRSPRIVLWALFLAVSLDTDGGLARRSAIQTIRQICQSLSVASGTDLRNILDDIFYCPVLQDEASARLWYEMEPYMKKPASNEGAPGGYVIKIAY